MIHRRTFLPLCAAPLLFAPLALFAAAHLNAARKTSAHPAASSVRTSHSRSRHWRSRHHHAVLPARPSSSRIEEIQGALARAGYYKADPSGKWDGDTVDAMKRFQGDQGLGPTGKIDALTLQKLGLGSGTAGLGAPHPPPPAPVKPSSNQ